MDDEDVAAADLKDVGRRAGIWVSLIKLGLKSQGFAESNGGKGRPGEHGGGVQQWCGLNRAKRWAKAVALSCPALSW